VSLRSESGGYGDSDPGLPPGQCLSAAAAARRCGIEDKCSRGTHAMPLRCRETRKFLASVTMTPGLSESAYMGRITGTGTESSPGCGPALALAGRRLRLAAAGPRPPAAGRPSRAPA
jgi:hypothetical protein